MPSSLRRAWSPRSWLLSRERVRMLGTQHRYIEPRYRQEISSRYTRSLPTGGAVGRNRTAVLEFAVLGLLHRTPMHGYELSKQLNSLLGAFRAVAYGTLYPCLNKLYEEGLIAKEDDAPGSAQLNAAAPGP